MSAPRPPRLARALLRLLLHPRTRDPILGDLAEEYARLDKAGPGARRWYWRQVLQSVGPSLRHRSRRADPPVGGRESPPLGHQRRGGGFGTDLRLAVRGLRGRPGLTLPWIATLALGIGATTAIFTVVDGVLLRPLPFPAADRLVAVCEVHPSIDEFCIASPPNVDDWSARANTFEALGLGREWVFVIQDETNRNSVQGGLATPGLFTVLGPGTTIGRAFQDEDMETGASRVALLSHGIWASNFGSDPAVLSRPLVLDGEPHEVIGVLRPDFAVPGLENVEVWTPLPFSPTDEENRDWRGFLTFGRLVPGVSLADAQQEMTGLADLLGGMYPRSNAGWGVRLEPLHDHVVGSVREALRVFLGAVGLLMLIACANVANLALVRGQRRSRELAIRAALGARRWGLVRLLLAESLVLAVAGGAVGLGLANLGVRSFLALAPAGIPLLDQVHLDFRVFVFASALSLVAGTLVALLPALRVTRVDLRRSLREGDGRRSATTLRRGLVVGEVSLALVLLVGAGLLARSFMELARYEPGFDRENVLTTWVFISSDRYPTGREAVALFARLEDELRALPGVTHVGSGSAGPLFGGNETERINIVGQALPESGREPVIRYYDIGPGYFPTLGIPVVRGRNLEGGDTEGAPLVALVNETLAQRHWPGEDPLGQQVHMVDFGWTVEVVGVVADVRPLDPEDTPAAEVYWPARQHPRFATYFLIRTDSEPEALARSVENRLQQAEPDLSIGALRTLDARLGQQLVRPRFDMTLLGTFAATALLLAMVGIYGVVSQGVAERHHEIGIRISLGARSRQVVTMVLREGLLLAAAGVAVGMVAAVALTRFMRGMLVGIDPVDPATLTILGVTVATVACVAALIPARRASRVDPMKALRWE